MKNNKYKLISFDLDGTLLNTQMVLDDSTKSGLIKIIENGFICIVNSSRSLSSILEITGDIKFYYISALNGALVYNNNELKVEYINQIDKELYKRIFKFIIDNNITANIFSEDNVYISGYSGKDINKKYQMSLNPKTLEDIPEEIEVLSIEFILENHEENLIIKKKLEEYNYHLNIKNAGNDYLEITDKDTDKGRAFNFIINKLGVLREQTISMGDSLTDIPVFIESGLSIAMKNSDKIVLKSAKLITKKDNAHNGAVDFLINNLKII